MEVSDKLIGVALEAYDSKAGYSKIEKMRSALAAALSAAEPVAWRIVGKLNTGSRTWKVVQHEHQAREEAKSWEKMCAVEVHPLYAAPPAPSVAVKALEWVENVAEAVTGDYWIVNATQKWLYRSPHVKIAPFDTVEAAKLAAQADYEARIRSALV